MSRQTGICVLFASGVGALFLVGCSPAVDRVSADRFVATGELIALSGGYAGAPFACATCHGLDGSGNGAGAPRLSGLDPGYLHRQMEGYAAGLRKHAQMEHVAAKLTSEQRRTVSLHYATLPAPEPRPMPAAPAPDLWARGDPARGLQPCALCHGERGEGAGPGNPALGRQPAAYLSDQLRLWRSGERRNDPDNVMQRISRRLAPSEVPALAAYAGALPADPARPEFREAFPAAHRAGPRSDVSGQRQHEAVSTP